MDKPLTVCVLLYGDYPVLARRCLESIWTRLENGHHQIYDFRIATNMVSDASRAVIDWFSRNVLTRYGTRVIRYECAGNACKYPMIRRMILDDPIPPGEFVVWFDDDSYVDGGPEWFSFLASQLLIHSAMFGKIYTQRVAGEQWKWVQQQAWYNPSVGRPPVSPRHRSNPSFRFCTGGWWVIRSEVLRRYNWPTPELRHRGGDALLGELCRHIGLRLHNFETGVRINADDQGRHSKSPRRGEDEKQLGYIVNNPPDLSHQEFVLFRTVLGGNNE